MDSVIERSTDRGPGRERDGPAAGESPRSEAEKGTPILSLQRKWSQRSVWRRRLTAGASPGARSRVRYRAADRRRVA